MVIPIFIYNFAPRNPKRVKKKKGNVMIEKEKVEKFLQENKSLIDSIKDEAFRLHDVECNQKYGDGLPYSYHLGMVAEYATKWMWMVCGDESHILPIIFGAFFHDSIEDARMTYNDILRLAKTFMDSRRALIATEIVYALTDEKGRNRAERGSDKHYEDIRNTLYAPFVKFCDRFANAKFSIDSDSRMLTTYKAEMPLFIEKIGGSKYVPQELIDEILNIETDYEQTEE